MTLEELYNKIKDLSPLPLVPDVFPKGNIFTYYSSAVQNGDFTIDNPKATTKTDAKGTIIEVHVHGITDSYNIGNKLPIDLPCTTELGDIYLNAIAQMQGQKLAIPGISWFSISDISLSAAIYEAT